MTDIAQKLGFANTDTAKTKKYKCKKKLDMMIKRNYSSSDFLDSPMATNREYSKLIEQYFSGELSQEDKLLFEGRVASDPVLKSEFENQTKISP